MFSHTCCCCFKFIVYRIHSNIYFAFINQYRYFDFRSRNHTNIYISIIQCLKNNEATPGFVAIPAPTTDSFAILSSCIIFVLLIFVGFLLILLMFVPNHFFCTVNDISFVSSRPIDCNIISTLIFFSCH